MEQTTLQGSDQKKLEGLRRTERVMNRRKVGISSHQEWKYYGSGLCQSNGGKRWSKEVMDFILTEGDNDPVLVMKVKASHPDMLN